VPKPTDTFTVADHTSKWRVESSQYATADAESDGHMELWEA